MTHHGNDKGFAPVLIAVIIALVLGVAGAAFIIMKRSAPGSKAPAAEERAEAPKTADEQLDALAIEAPRFDAASASPMPALDASALNVTAPALPGEGIFTDLGVNTGTSYSYTLDIPVPAVQLTIPEYAAPPASTGGQTEGSSGGSTDGGEQGGSGSSPQVNAANCAQFSAMPSAQYCAQVGDPNGKTLCEQCKAAGF